MKIVLALCSLLLVMPVSAQQQQEPKKSWSDRMKAFKERKEKRASCIKSEGALYCWRKGRLERLTKGK